MTRGPNVRIDGMVHDAKARAGRTQCGVRFVLYATISNPGKIRAATETTDTVDCMTCLVRTDT